MRRYYNGMPRIEHMRFAIDDNFRPAVDHLYKGIEWGYLFSHRLT